MLILAVPGWGVPWPLMLLTDFLIEAVGDVGYSTTATGLVACKLAAST